MLPSVASAVIVASALGWGETFLTGQGLLVLGTAMSTYLTIVWVMWGVAFLADVLHYASLIALQRSAPKTAAERFAIDDNPREMVEPSRPGTTSTVHSNPFHPESKTSSPPSLIHSDGASSRRTSLSTVPRPSSSRRGIHILQSSYSHQSARSSMDRAPERASQDEGFDSWDTSAVASQIRETVLQSKQTIRGTGLEPIPGSRSPSPAKALEGPFFQPGPLESPPPSPLPQPPISRPSSPPSSPLNLPSFTAMFPPSSPTSPSEANPAWQRSVQRAGSKSGTPPRRIITPRSRPGSSAHSLAPSYEEHIHPLFRSSSPTPPPSASANTTVTAAPEAGQLINELMLKRMRSGSLPSCPSPLVRSQSTDDIRPPKVPTSPSLDTFPGSLVGSRPLPSHRRKRSASFQGAIEG
ncbi:hypothetical protein MMC21_003425 [Puttea exsequens]|nr:hypothetical protein [Puttea exsequens]